MRTVLILVFVVAFSACDKVEDTGCIDPSKIDKNAMCTMEYNPVCGCDGKTYGNACDAKVSGVTKYTQGACGSDK